MKKSLPRKIIYFDETSAVDLLQVRQKGHLTRTEETIRSMTGKIGADADIKAQLDEDVGVNKLVSHISGLSAGINSMMGANGSLNGSKIARTVIENSLLYDFLESAESKRGTPLLDIREDYALSIPKDSMTYFATIAPLTEMMEGHQQLDNPDITMAISKMNSGIRNSKGYYEVVGEKTDSKFGKSITTQKVFRFNIDAFKNNYRIQDLPKMNLVLYAIHVGTTKLSQLDFETEFNLDSQQSEVGFSGLAKQAQSHQDADSNDEKSLDVFDVVLAGVR